MTVIWLLHFLTAASVDVHFALHVVEQSLELVPLPMGARFDRCDVKVSMSEMAGSIAAVARSGPSFVLDEATGSILSL